MKFPTLPVRVRRRMVYLGQFLILHGLDGYFVTETPEDVAQRRESYLVNLQEEGHDVRKITDYHYRIDKKLDIYPVNARWHDLRNQERGTFEGFGVLSFVKKRLEDPTFPPPRHHNCRSNQ